MGISGGSSSGQTSSDSYGYSQSLAQSLQRSQSSVWGGQAGALQDLYGRATNLADQQQGQVSNAANQAVRQGMPLYDQASDTLSKLAGGGGPLARYATPNNALAKQQLSQMSQQIGQNFSREILPGIRTDAGAVGGMGGSREQIAKGLAAGGAADAIARAGTDLYAQQYQTGAAAAEALSGQRQGAAAALPGIATSAYQLAMSPFQAAWSPISSLASAIGGPTLVSQSAGLSRAQTQAENWGKSRGSQSSNQWGMQLF
jgi:hypothetical protein